MKKKLLIVLACIVACIGVIFGIYYPDSDINNEISEVQNAIIDEIQNIEDEGTINNKTEEVIISEQTEELVIQTKEAINRNEDLSTTEVIKSSEEEENNLEEEQLETDAVLEQENISYNGDNTGNGLSLLGAYQGLTYYSQADSRWANVLYTSTGNTSQTMKSSACGPTSASIVVSSSKGVILPTTMASLAVDNGYRTVSDGTAWAFFPFVADYFDFNEYYTTSSFNTAMNYLRTDEDSDGNVDYYVIVSCGSGLFTTGGHYIVLVGLDDDIIQVYDPYLYSGKFTTASRKNAGAVVSGNSVFVSETSFQTYANAKNYWVFSNDKGEGSPNTTSNNSSTNSDTSTTSSTTAVNYTRYVATQSLNLNVRYNPNGNIIGSLTKGTAVNVIEVNGNWSKINSPVSGWVSSTYLSSSTVTPKVNTSTSINYSTVVGSTYKLKSRTTLYASSSMSGTYYTYLAKTQIKVLKHISSTIDYIYIPATGRYAYCYVSAFTSLTNTTTIVSNSTIGNYKKLKSRTILYANSSMTGTYYTYLANTKVKIIRNVTSNIDYIYIPATGRYAYCYKSAYK